MDARHERPILVVGAGVTGLTLACVLRRHGTHFRIVDKLSGIRPQARAVGIHSRTMELLQDLGLADAIADKCVKIKAVNQIANGKKVLQARYDVLEVTFPYLACLEQWKTEGVFEAHLSDLGVAVERQTELVAVEERLDGVRATLRKEDGSTELVDTPWLIGCDGAHSAVRHLNRQHFPGETDSTQYLIADVTTNSSPYAPDEVSFFLSDAGYFSWGPLPEGRILITADMDQSPHAPDAPPTLADVQALLDARSPERVEVHDPRWLGWFRTNYRLTPHYRHGRTFLAGDAAHIHSPVGGQGMNTGIQDAYNLGWKLALVGQGAAPVSLLDSYEAERRAIASDVLAITKATSERMLAYAGLPKADRERYFRHAHVPEAERLQSLRHSAQLDLDYRKSPVCVDHRHDAGTDEPGRGVHAGAEAIEAGPLVVDGRTTSVFELLAGPHHTLFLFAGAEAHGRHQSNAVHLAGEVARVYGDLIQVCIVLSADADTAAYKDTPATLVRDLAGRMHERHGAVAGRTILVRPDGYIGWCSDQPSLTAFREYLAKIFVCR